MYKKIAIIPARSGSKGLPNKNILTLIDRPLIAYTIEAALDSDVFDRVIVSTDSEEYKSIAEKYGAEVILREKELASDTATSFMVVKDVLSRIEVKPHYFVLLQPTSPFRNSKHIRDAVNIYENNTLANYLVSVTESEKSSSLIKEINDFSMRNYDIDYSGYRRQKHKEYYPNGAIFIGDVDSYLKKKHFFGIDSIPYFMDKRDSVDIDDELDFLFSITIANKLKSRESLDLRINNRIEEKKSQMNDSKSITLIGHSIFDYWNIEKIKGREVNNLGIAGINTKEYLDKVFLKNKILALNEYVILLCGTNDMVLDGWEKNDTLNWVNETIRCINKINPNTKIILLSVPRTRGRMDRNNKIIDELNVYLEKKINKNICFLDITTELSDEYGSLKSEFTLDGLHFTDLAYLKLKEIIERIL